ncbi:type VII secretion-associated serine protease mycosin [Actinomadura sp. 7K507]|uniref:type VII secretion-associated serine protease mycosin n=1 Tax=Actinomadura sp. 7K507 TaxID=2530365 RepID=UPI00105050DA|nr:type VII secretion-associated serine protease mycosin [Actinomadura sp. 7K507]TDC90347.1 type VII secretion-associated serine protease mycosin [Actinomadura sp. 7K507]
MRWLLRTAASAVAIGLAATPVLPAHAVPGPDPQQWWFDSWSIQKEVWPVTKGKGVTVAVIDTGVNAQLPDLKPAVLPGGDMTGKGGDGRKDYDTRQDGHGTGMASLIASQGTETGFVGVAPEAKILPIAAPSLSGPTTGKAVRFAADHGAKVINISQASPSAGVYPNQCPPQLLEAIKYAAGKDAVIVAGAGNSGDFDNKPAYPASCPGVVAVGALAHNGKPWKSTQRQDYVTVGAPGQDVGWINKEGHVFTAGEGTSQASALTSGAVALLRSRYPDMPARQIVQRLTATAKDFGPRGKDDMLGYGVISIPRALKQDVPATAPNPVYARLDKVGGAKAGAGATQPAAAEEEDSGGFPVLIAGGAVVVLLVLGGGAFLLLRRRRGPAAPPGPGGTVPPPPQPFGAPQPGPAQPGPAQPGPAQPGSAQPGSAQPGPAQPPYQPGPQDQPPGR